MRGDLVTNGGFQIRLSGAWNLTQEQRSTSAFTHKKYYSNRGSPELFKKSGMKRIGSRSSENELSKVVQNNVKKLRFFYIS